MLGQKDIVGDHTFAGNNMVYIVFKDWQFVRHVRICI